MCYDPNISFGGDGRIRTSETREGLPVFKTGAFVHSATSPDMIGARLLYEICASLANCEDDVNDHCESFLQKYVIIALLMRSLE